MEQHSGPVIVTPASTDVMTVAQFKTKWGITGTADDTRINEAIATATDYVQRRIGQQLIQATLKQTYDRFPVDGVFRLDRRPISSVSSLKYYDVDGTLQTIASTNYFVDTDSRPARLILKSSYSIPEVQDERPSAVLLEYVAGYSSTTLIPPGVMTAVNQLTKHLYENPGIVITSGAVPQEIPYTLDAMINLHNCNGYR